MVNDAMFKFGETAWFTNDGILEKCMQMQSHKQILLIKLQGGHQANRSKIDTHLSSQQSNNKRGIMVEQTRFSWASKCL